MKRKKQGLRPVTVFVICECILAIALAVALYVCGMKYSDPRRVMDQYCEAVMNKDWNAMYDLLNLPETSSLSKSMFINANRKNSGSGVYGSFYYKEEEGEGQTASYEWKNDRPPKTLGYEAVFKKISDGSEVSQRVVLVRAGKKLLLFDQWKVSPRIFVATNVGFTIPKGAALRLNGAEILVNKKAEGDWQTFAIPYLFRGSYQLEVSMEGMETYREELSVRENDSMKEVTLLPAQAAKEELLLKAEQDVKGILDAAFTKKSFGTISDYFSTESLKDGTIQQAFNDLKRLASIGGETGITWVDIMGIQEKVSGNTEADGTVGQNEILVTMTGHVKEKFIYMSPEINALANGEKEFDVEIQLRYTKVNGQWRLISLPVSAQMFG